MIYKVSEKAIFVIFRPDGPKYKRAREWQTGVVNAQWLTDLLCGQMGALHQSDAPKYQQFSLGNPFRLDYSLVPHLMGKILMKIMLASYLFCKFRYFTCLFCSCLENANQHNARILR